MYHQLRAALGFLELGDPDSAWEELESSFKALALEDDDLKGIWE
jgi:hypothetical protein